ncbi:flagellar biosynthesis protein FlhF [Salibacterium salarium]|uniref:Flagellar biosynthesis protein FlhF n=1 Tax=Salibacterium salarium TaxID=284579 RepID=A0A3R9QL35_9BACI|nr:flagellar biosynthesis protein FlhF [Salibacterium salarium]RSL33184.1 flagellar biosynthesis protein FlhF [Salibacterium salarium]
MKVKKFTAKDMPEAMKKIRTELGDQAVILNSKHVDTGGIFGFFTKKSIEVIAAKDETPAPASDSRTKTEPDRPTPTVQSTTAPQQQTQVQPKEVLQDEVKELKNMIASLKEDQNTSTTGYPAPIQTLEAELSEQEVQESIRYYIIKQLLSNWYRSNEEPDVKTVKEWAKTYLQEVFSASEMGPVPTSKKIINLVGPTGVGKTTTVAKIAAHYHLEEKKSVALITTDTYRIAAVEQLKTYAKILDIPVSVAYSMEDFRDAKEKFQDKDLILIDSAGRNFTNQLYVKELRKIINFDEDMTTYLVLALTSKYKDMKKIYEQFSLITIDRFIFTKKDETSYYGAMVNMMAQSSTGTAYVTHGQSVPDDIDTADSAKIAEWVVEGYE